MSKVSIHIITWNGERFIENTMKSLDAQVFKDFSILIIDNGSDDQTVPWLREYYPQVKIVENRRNLGFCKSNNQAFHFTDSEYVLAMNQDIILSENYLEKVVKEFEINEEVGSVQGKIYKVIGDPTNLTPKSFTQVFDSTGIKAYRSRRFVERGSGEEDTGQYDKEGEVFGVSGALPCYRRSSLEDIKINNEYFDEDFWSYKEDIDLAWRLRLRGWQAKFIPEAVAYHHRTASIKDKLWDKGLALSIVSSRKDKPLYVHIPSYRNHFCLLTKNEQNFSQDWIFILWYEFRKFIYILFFEPKTFKGLFQYFKLRSKMKDKRKIIQSKARVGRKDIRKWFK